MLNAFDVASSRCLRRSAFWSAAAGVVVLTSGCGLVPDPPTAPSAVASSVATASTAPGTFGGHSIEALFGECLAGSANPACRQPTRSRADGSADARVAPLPPSALTAVVTGNRVTLSWTAPGDVYPVTTYVLQGGTASGASDLANFPTGNLSTSFASPPLPPGVYFVRVLARNADGDSAASNEVSFTIGAPPGTPLDAPVLSFTLQGSMATFTWTTANRDSATGYLLQAGDQAGAINLAAITLPAVPLSFTTPPLAAGTYFVRVAGIGTLGHVGPSSNEVVVPVAGPPQNARYRATFEATWSAQTHPVDIPPNPHFSRLIGATHGPSVEFWRPGASASPGIQNMAERGSTSPLDQEIAQAQAAGLAQHLFIGGGLGLSPGQVAVEFDITRDFPLVTLVSMIAPSPDWFVGVRNVSLLNGDWKDELVIDLYPWDAGTDSGTTYGAPDQVTVPRGVITLLQGPPVAVGGQVAPFGRFVFRKIG